MKPGGGGGGGGDNWLTGIGRRPGGGSGRKGGKMEGRQRERLLLPLVGTTRWRSRCQRTRCMSTKSQ